MRCFCCGELIEDGSDFEMTEDGPLCGCCIGEKEELPKDGEEDRPKVKGDFDVSYDY